MNQVQYLIPVAFITNPEGKILMVKKLKAKSDICINRWELPGGTTKFGESFQEALKRKIKEYLGIDIEVGEIIPHVHSNIGKGEMDGVKTQVQSFIVAARCKIIGNGSLQPLEGKIGGIGWFSFEEFSAMPKSERVLGDLEIIIKNRERL